MSVMFAGVGKSRIYSRNFLDGRTLVGVISKPANSTVSCANTNVLGFNLFHCFGTTVAIPLPGGMLQ